tara:strand:- start:47198 stop:47626 length:429 start_codon:yes stop_codon:yes gene_type:complete
MKNSIAALVVGFVFAIGLGLSGMTQPQKVIGFLDLFGQWDPSLIFVMVGAIIVHFVTFKLIRKRNSPLFSSQWHVPTKKEITPALMIGAFIFGIGWALGGFCPGPAITSMASFDKTPFVFVISMVVGMVLFRHVDKKLKLQK